MRKSYFTSESVTEGHPDKVCDRIADKILDLLLEKDPMSRCACEVIAESGHVHIMGEITSEADIDYEKAARDVIREIGYTKNEYGFTDRCNITCSIHKQSPDIAMGVDDSIESKNSEEKSTGAGDQGMMFGFACSETENFMPLPIQLANSLTAGLTALRKSGIVNYLRPDGKSQVTVEYHDGKAKRIEAIVVSAQHDPEIDIETLRKDIFEKLILKAIPPELIDEDTKIFINPTGRFVLGGPAADTGLTGRKIIADTYGGYSRHGGGSFSGKDPTKVDRSAAYMARFIAKHIVASGIAEKCEIQLSYAIGVAKPLSVFVDTFGTGKIPESDIEKWIEKNIDLRPDAIIGTLGLRSPVYYETSAYGHFGKLYLPWEGFSPRLIDSIENLKSSY